MNKIKKIDIDDIKFYKTILGDSRKLIKAIPDSSIDLILTDPPYNLSPYSTGNIKLKWRKDINNDLALWDKVEFNPSEWVDDFKRIIKPHGNIFAFTSYNLIGKWHDAFDSEFDTFQFMVWHKTNPAPKIFKAGFLNSCELIVALWNKKHKWNFISQKEMHNFIETPICMGAERVKNPKHPTQKPVKLLKHIIRISTDENDIVFDPFMGVGSTGVAALEMQRRFIGFEIDKAYYDVARKRLKSTPLNLFTDKAHSI
ncbi:MAG TPA: site-specific DNA-methyltransferase [candidate division WOR-3 bacterium]|uniref:Methyltransferase n=1 Tax=candidate division WOR-3 bacterium TaxID=2052148 RepID=A0A9C9K0J8_UNCW3|nr:site-specific DNA-methyltransferase [candidate division WOR-3 bacterium]